MGFTHSSTLPTDRWFLAHPLFNIAAGDGSPSAGKQTKFIHPLFNSGMNIDSPFNTACQTSKNLNINLSTGHRCPAVRDISGNMGLVSAGRIDKDTPPLTTPSYTSKSSAMDTSSHIFQIIIHEVTQRRFRPKDNPRLV